MRVTTFAHTRRAIGLAVALTLVAMACYPGGTTLDRTTAGYSWSQNFLSDLGMTVAYDGRPNAAGALCFVAALGVLVIGLGRALLGFARGYAVTAAARRLAYAAGIVGAAASVAFVGVALTPEDRAMTLHIRFTKLGFQLLPLALGLLTWAAHASAVAPRRVVSVWGALSAVLVGYAALLTCGPGLATPAWLTTYVLAQKAVAFTLVTVAAYQSVVVEKRT